MTLSESQLIELKKVAEPLMVWMEKNCHPHVTAIVDSIRIELLEGLATRHRNENSNES